VRLGRGGDSTVERGQALCILGNHELNAIAWFDGLRDRSPNKLAQHAEFLRQVGEGSDLHREIVDWLRGRPLFLDLGGIRVVHAWWHPESLELIAGSYWDGERICGRFLRAAFEMASGTVVRTDLPRRTPRSPASRISRSTVQRATARPSRCNWRQTLSAP